ncbi:MAG: 2-amino-4-hydroxy-6-hydroxymethyldihydropteridine diphosphokinase [Bacteroidales bacterium]|nr:2-amino-4-hydroxy-6-hydroxymethyldihydropteridine diphosphokinase [Bacteroidales bacterium]
MSIVYLGLGTNLGDKKQNLNRAVQQISLEVGRVLNVSSIYQSKPWGFDSENDFLNAVLVVQTELAPLDLLEKTQQIERKLGRLSKIKKGYSDRLIDIDILLYDNQVINLPQLIIPHKLLHKRDFVLMPLAELAPKLVHPVLEKTMKELSEQVVNTTTILKDDERKKESSD